MLKIQLCRHRSKLQLNYIQKKTFFLAVIIFHNFDCIFDQMNAALVNIRDL